MTRVGQLLRVEEYVACVRCMYVCVRAPSPGPLHYSCFRLDLSTLAPLKKHACLENKKTNSDRLESMIRD